MRRSQTVAPRLGVRTSQIRAEINSRLGSKTLSGLTPYECIAKV